MESWLVVKWKYKVKDDEEEGEEKIKWLKRDREIERDRQRETDENRDTDKERVIAGITPLGELTNLDSEI